MLYCFVIMLFPVLFAEPEKTSKLSLIIFANLRKNTGINEKIGKKGILMESM